MQVYLVGGAVRDQLLGRPVAERDWVVVGATAEQMQRLGYRSVGREFPVFLHPQTHEEYALARLERKVAPGYRGFVTQFSPEVTIEQDLKRRDLTINAMARDGTGRLIDPFGGERDLRERRLRHVSAAFVEDPVRALRVARFAARYAGLGFTVAPETRALMRAMVDSGELSALVPERIWRELERALGEPDPEAFFKTLEDCGALPGVLPGLAWHDADRRALEASVRLSTDSDVRWAALLAAGPPAAVESLCQRLRAPGEHRALAQLAARLCPQMVGLAGPRPPPTPETLLALLEAADAMRRPQRFGKLLLACQARHGSGELTTLLRMAASTATDTPLPADQREGRPGPEIAAQLRSLRLEQLGRLLRGLR